METYDEYDAHDWHSVCCGNSGDPYLEDKVMDVCPKCEQQAAWECVKCQNNTHKKVGSLDSDPLSLHIMKAVGDVLRHYKGGTK